MYVDKGEAEVNFSLAAINKLFFVDSTYSTNTSTDPERLSEAVDIDGLVLIYPNPVRKYLNIPVKPEQSGEIEIQIYIQSANRFIVKRQQ